jgi:hypothetical protein
LRDIAISRGRFVQLMASKNKKSNERRVPPLFPRVGPYCAPNAKEIEINMQLIILQRAPGNPVVVSWCSL